ncbi:hypothetical protein [Streptomyces longispororuber]|uniref:hypothetical protein n=1 Tax=Streptomyces longispororuber TaxID=68230 RepID=UPI0036FBC8EF
MATPATLIRANSERWNFPPRPAHDPAAADHRRGQKYYRGPLMVPLRCGDRKWGYKRLVTRGRWSKPSDKKTGGTIWSGAITANTPGERKFERLQPGCPPRGSFRVITNPGVYSGDHRINPQGVITAYKPREGSSAAVDC